MESIVLEPARAILPSWHYGRAASLAQGTAAFRNFAIIDEIVCSLAITELRVRVLRQCVLSFFQVQLVETSP